MQLCQSVPAGERFDVSFLLAEGVGFKRVFKFNRVFYKIMDCKAAIIEVP